MVRHLIYGRMLKVVRPGRGYAAWLIQIAIVHFVHVIPEHFKFQQFGFYNFPDPDLQFRRGGS